MSSTTRRRFLKTAAVGLPALMASNHPVHAGPKNDKPRSVNERLGIGAIGMRYQGSVITLKAQAHGDVVAIADVDRHVREQARASFGSTPRIFEDYRDLLKRKDVDVVMIGAPDHWHTKMLLDALRAGKDVYCEKPLTLTIDEGKVIRKVAQQANRVVQVGTWQRNDSRFRTAVEFVRAGGLGKLKRVACITDKNPAGGPFETRKVPAHFNWDLWQGQTPHVPYIPERSHYTFRWWYEYSGGKMTDWGAHHIDIAQWAINSLPTRIQTKGTASKFRVGLGGYSVHDRFAAKITYANGVELIVRDEGPRGILFEGEKGTLFVSRSRIFTNPKTLLAGASAKRSNWRVYPHENHKRPPRAGKYAALINHMGNFFDCIASRKQTISDLESQHRSVTTCHLANISLRLGKPLSWDPKTEQFTGSNAKSASQMMSREQRKGYETR